MEVPGARTVRLGAAATTRPFVADGYLYVTILPKPTPAIKKRKRNMSEAAKEKHRLRERNRARSNPQANRDRVATWRHENKEKKSAADKHCHQRNREQNLERMKQYSKDNRVSIRAAARVRESSRRKTDTTFVITKRMRARLGAFTRSKRTPKQGHTFSLIGLSPEGLVRHLQGQMPGGSLIKKQTDHIFPLSIYNIASEGAQFMAMHFSNLQPLTRMENKDKSDKLPTKAMAAKVERWAWPPGVTEDMLPDIYDGWATPLRM